MTYNIVKSDFLMLVRSKLTKEIESEGNLWIFQVG